MRSNSMWPSKQTQTPNELAYLPPKMTYNISCIGTLKYVFKKYLAGVCFVPEGKCVVCASMCVACHCMYVVCTCVWYLVVVCGL